MAYVDTNKVLETAQDGFHSDFEGNLANLISLREVLEDTPTADVAEVRHGRINWRNRPISAKYATVVDEFGNEHYGKLYERIEDNPVGYCSECGKRLDDTFMNYCPNCGAKMDGNSQKEVE